MIANAIADDRIVGEMAGLMRLLGDPTRIRVLHLLQPGEMNVSSLCSVLDLAQPTVSHHLGLLRQQRLVQTRRSGKHIFYSLNPDLVRHREEQNDIQLTVGPIELCLGRRAPVAAPAPPIAAPAAPVSAAVETPSQPARLLARPLQPAYAMDEHRDGEAA